MKFNELELKKEIQKALKDLGYEDATKIQEETIPEILKGKDVIGQSQTGTGKTAAFGLPIIEKIDVENKNTQAIVILPTRELAIQVAEELKKFSKYVAGLNIATVYGGQGMEVQIRNLKKGAQIVVGTPGRMMDHLRRKTLKLNDTKVVVLDEADEMLNMGFEEDIHTILDKVPEMRQIVLFSATLSARIMKIANKYLHEPVNVKLENQNLTVDKIKQIVIEVKSKEKDEGVIRLIDFYEPKKCIIFSNTKSKVDELSEFLIQYGYKAQGLHGDMKQNQRERIMNKLKKGEINILIATDVAARGIDVDSLDLVINYDIPQEVEYYVHRIGRTGRNGKDGVAVTFTTTRSRSKLEELQRYLKIKFKLSPLPDNSKLEERRNLELQKNIQQAIDRNIYKKSNIYNELVEYNGIERVAKALFTMVTSPKDIMKKDNIKSKETSSRDKDKRNSKDNSKKGKHKLVDSSSMRLFVNIGKLDKVREKDLRELFVKETTVTSEEIKRIKVLDKFSFVEVPIFKADESISSLNKKSMNGRHIDIEIANN